MNAAVAAGAQTDTRPHVVVVGAGFAGLSAVRSLRKAPVRVTLIDRHSYSTFQPLLYQVATGALNPGDITYGARSFVASVSHKGQTWATFRKGVVTEIDPDAKVLTLDVGPSLSYDYLVLANGVTTNYFGVPGAMEHAYPIYTRAEALLGARPDDGLPRPHLRHEGGRRRLGGRRRRRRHRRGDGGHPRRAAQLDAARPATPSSTPTTSRSSWSR